MMKIATYIYTYFVILLICGTIFVYSSSSFISFYFYKNSFYFYAKQVIAVVSGIIIVFLLMKLKIEIYKKYFLYIYGAIIFFNLCPFIPFIGYSINGASRWVRIWIFIFQPSEILKFGYLFYNAFIFYFYYDQVRYVLLFVFLNIIGVSIILTLQSDFGLIVLFYGITFIFLWYYLYDKKILLYPFFFGTIIICLLIYFTPYRLSRLIIFCNPWNDPQGKGFQIIQSLIAIYRGGLCGNGIGNSLQKNLFLPMCHTDFIFSIMIEDCGIIFCFIFLIFLLYFPYQIIKFSYQTTDLWDRNYMRGVALLIIFQTIINIGASIALLPTKGIGLPFISYGMSSIIGFSVLIGIIVCMTKRI